MGKAWQTYPTIGTGVADSDDLLVRDVDDATDNTNYGTVKRLAVADLASFALRQSAAAPTGAVFDADIAAYGNSYIRDDPMSAVGRRWTLQAIHHLGLGSFDDRAANGSSVVDIARQLIANTSTPLTLPGTGMVWVSSFGGPEQGILIDFDHTNAQHLQSVEDAARAVAAICSAQAKAESSTFTASGTWSTSTNAIWSGGSTRSTTVEGDYLEWTQSAPGWVFLVAYDPTYFGAREVTVTVDSVVIETVTPIVKVGATGESLAWYPVQIPAGTARVTAGSVGAAGPGSAFCGVDFATTDADGTRPLLLLPIEPDIFGTGAEHAAITQAIADGLQGFNDEFGTGWIIRPDLSIGWDRTTMIGDDTIHLNDRGQGHYANHVISALAAADFFAGLNTLTTI